MSTYNNLHASIHAKYTHVKVHHCVSQSSTSFAWVTPVFEFYCVAGPHANRNALAQSASKIVQWVEREEERLFIIGGAVSVFFFFVAWALSNGISTYRSFSLLASFILSYLDIDIIQISVFAYKDI